MLMKLVSEFVGTFFLVMTVGLTVLEPASAGAFAPIAIGLMLAVMIYATGHISGGNFNPAVSLAVFLRGSLSFANLIGYWLAQFAAGALAATLAVYIKGTSGSPQTLNVSHAFIAEALFTFALCHVVLNVATAKETAGNSYFGLAIGATVIAGAYSVGPISGAVFNPSVSLGATMMNLSRFQDLWLYIVAQFVGAVVAALIFKLWHPKT